MNKATWWQTGKRQLNDRQKAPEDDDKLKLKARIDDLERQLCELKREYESKLNRLHSMATNSPREEKQAESAQHLQADADNILIDLEDEVSLPSPAQVASRSLAVFAPEGDFDNSVNDKFADLFNKRRRSSNFVEEWMNSSQEDLDNLVQPASISEPLEVFQSRASNYIADQPVPISSKEDQQQTIKPNNLIFVDEMLQSSEDELNNLSSQDPSAVSGTNIIAAATDYFAEPPVASQIETISHQAGTNNVQKLLIDDSDSLEENDRLIQTFGGSKMEFVADHVDAYDDVLSKSHSYIGLANDKPAAKRVKRNKQGRVEPGSIAQRLCPPRPDIPTFDFIKKNEGFVGNFTPEDFDVDNDRLTKSFAGNLGDFAEALSDQLAQSLPATGIKRLASESQPEIPKLPENTSTKIKDESKQIDCDANANKVAAEATEKKTDNDEQRLYETFGGVDLREMMGLEIEIGEQESFTKSCSYFAFPSANNGAQQVKRNKDGKIKHHKVAERLCPSREIPSFSFLKKNEGFVFTEEDFKTESSDRLTKSFAGRTIFEQDEIATKPKPGAVSLTLSFPEAALRRHKLNKVNPKQIADRLYPKDLSASGRPKFAFLRRSRTIETSTAVTPAPKTNLEEESAKPFTSEDSTVEQQPNLDLNESQAFSVPFDPLSSSAATTAYGSSVSSYRSPMLSDKFSGTSDAGKSPITPDPAREIGSDGGENRPVFDKKREIRMRAEQRRMVQRKLSSDSSDHEGQTNERRWRNKGSGSSIDSSYELKNFPPVKLPTREDRLSISHSMDMMAKAKLLSSVEANQSNNTSETSPVILRPLVPSVSRASISSYSSDSFERSTDDDRERKSSDFLSASLNRNCLPENEGANSLPEELSETNNLSNESCNQSPEKAQESATVVNSSDQTNQCSDRAQSIVADSQLSTESDTNKVMVQSSVTESLKITDSDRTTDTADTNNLNRSLQTSSEVTAISIDSLVCDKEMNLSPVRNDSNDGSPHNSPIVRPVIVEIAERRQWGPTGSYPTFVHEEITVNSKHHMISSTPAFISPDSVSSEMLSSDMASANGDQFTKEKEADASCDSLESRDNVDSLPEADQTLQYLKNTATGPARFFAIDDTEKSEQCEQIKYAEQWQELIEKTPTEENADTVSIATVSLMEDAVRAESPSREALLMRVGSFKNGSKPERTVLNSQTSGNTETGISTTSSKSAVVPNKSYNSIPEDLEKYSDCIALNEEPMVEKKNVAPLGPDSTLPKNIDVFDEEVKADSPATEEQVVGGKSVTPLGPDNTLPRNVDIFGEELTIQKTQFEQNSIEAQASATAVNNPEHSHETQSDFETNLSHSGDTNSILDESFIAKNQLTTPPDSGKVLLQSQTTVVRVSEVTIFHHSLPELSQHDAVKTVSQVNLTENDFDLSCSEKPDSPTNKEMNTLLSNLTQTTISSGINEAVKSHQIGENFLSEDNKSIDNVQAISLTSAKRDLIVNDDPWTVTVEGKNPQIQFTLDKNQMDLTEHQSNDADDIAKATAKITDDIEQTVYLKKRPGKMKHLTIETTFLAVSSEDESVSSSRSRSPESRSPGYQYSSPFLSVEHSTTHTAETNSVDSNTKSENSDVLKTEASSATPQSPTHHAHSQRFVPGNAALDRLYGMLDQAERNSVGSSVDDDVLKVTVVDGVPYVTMMPKQDDVDSEYEKNFEISGQMKPEVLEDLSTSETDDSPKHLDQNVVLHSESVLENCESSGAPDDPLSQTFPQSCSSNVRAASSMPDLIFSSSTNSVLQAEDTGLDSSLNFSEKQVRISEQLAQKSKKETDKPYRFSEKPKKAVSWTDLSKGEPLEIGPSGGSSLANSPIKPIIKRDYQPPPIPPRPTYFSRRKHEESGFATALKPLTLKLSDSILVRKNRNAATSSSKDTDHVNLNIDSQNESVHYGSNHSVNSLYDPPSPCSTASFGQIHSYRVRRLFDDLRCLVKERDRVMTTLDQSIFTLDNVEQGVAMSSGLSESSRIHCRQFHERVYNSKIELDTRIADLWTLLKDSELDGLLERDRTWIFEVTSSADLTVGLHISKTPLPSKVRQQRYAEKRSSTNRLSASGQSGSLQDLHALEYQRKLAELRGTLVGACRDLPPLYDRNLTALNLHIDSALNSSGYHSPASQDMTRERQRMTASWVASFSSGR